LPLLSKYSEPDEWQHSAVWCWNVRMRCSELVSSELPLTLKRETTCVPVLSGSCE